MPNLIIFCLTKYKRVSTEQQAHYEISTFTIAGRACTLIAKVNKIIIPFELQDPVVHWYHKHICHPGQTQTELTVAYFLFGTDCLRQLKKYAPLVIRVN